MIETLFKFGGWIIIVGWVIIRWLSNHPEYGQKILLYIIRIIPFSLSWKKRKKIEKEIQAYINEERKIINKETFGFKILPQKISIEWSLPDKEKVIIREDEIIIRLGSRVNPAENFVDALVLFVEDSFLPTPRNMYLHSCLFDALKLQVAISMLKNRSDEHYLFFLEKYYRPSLKKYESELLNISEKLELIEKNGMLTSILLPTILFYTEKWIAQRKATTERIHIEFNDFLEFLKNIACKKEYETETGEEPPLTYKGTYLKVAVILVAKKEYKYNFNPKPYVEMAIGKLKYESDIIFISGSGRNISLAEIVKIKIEKNSFCEQINGSSKHKIYHQDNKSIDGICFAFQNKK